MENQTFSGRKIFPIVSETACLLKWSWSTVNIENATTSSCHRVDPNPIDTDNFETFHNLPGKIQAREAMLRGQWPGYGCEYCANVEKVGGISDRLMTLDRQHGLDKCPPELRIDPTATAVTPIILEIYFNNTCNLSCVYCLGEISSKINDELRKYGDINIDEFSAKLHVINNDRYDQLVSDLWKYLAENNRYKVIRHFHILGGESLLQKELDQSLDFWDNHHNDSLTINMITNLMLPHNQFVKKMQRFEELVKKNAILMLELTASLDCLGPQQEYIRYGIDLDLWFKNFEYVLSKDWCRPSVHSCINALSIKTMPELVQKINYWNQFRSLENKIEHNFDLPIGKGQKLNGLHPTNFGPGVFNKDFDRIIELMPEDNLIQQSAKSQMVGLSKMINKSKINIKYIKTLQKYLSELDRRRGTNWQEVFPWLTKDWD